MGRFGLARLAAARFGSCRFGRCFTVGGGAAYDFQFTGDMTVGVSGTIRGYRLGNYGALTPTVWEAVSWNRIYAIGSGASASWLARFNANAQFGAYASLWFKVGALDYFEATWNGADSYLVAAPGAAAVWSYMAGEAGNVITLVVEARS